MEGAKSAMYAQAGRNRGWSTVNPAGGEVSAPAQPMAAMPVPEIIPVPEIVPMPLLEPVAIPEPPVVTRPEMADTQENCQTVAMAYVKMQSWKELYEPEQGFSRGTIFAELDLPWSEGGECNYE